MAVFLFASFLLFFTLVVVCCIETVQEEALLFDRFTESVLLIPNGLSKEESCGAWTTACPVPESARGDLIKNALIVKDIYDRGSDAFAVKLNVCKEPYKLALVFDVTEMYFRFGFAIYYKLSDAEYFHAADLKRFETPAEITKLMGKNSEKKIKKMKSAKNDDRNSNDETWFQGNQKVEFLWFRMFSLKFDFSNKILNRIVYTILPNNKWPSGETCEDYSLGYEVYEETNAKYIDDLYSKNNQYGIFQGIKIPKRPDNNGVRYDKTPCEKERKCLSKWLLIPLDQFVFDSLTSSVCSNLATIPIWTDTVRRVLKKLDQYLYVLYRYVRETLLITAGVSDDVLELPLENPSWINKSSKIYLDPAKKKIPVPKIIYKIVKFRYLIDREAKTYSAWYSALIVIHNDPYYKGSKICNEDVTEDWGWQEIAQSTEDDKFGNIYVCRHDGDILRKVMGTSTAARQPQSADLNLFKFPSPTKGDKNPLNIKKYLDNEFNRLLRNGVIYNYKGKILERNGGSFQDESHITHGSQDPILV